MSNKQIKPINFILLFDINIVVVVVVATRYRINLVSILLGNGVVTQKTASVGRIFYVFYAFFILYSTQSNPIFFLY